MKTFKQFLAESKQLKEDNNRAHIYFRKDLSDKEKNEIKKMLQGANVDFNDLLKNGYHPIYTDKSSLKDRWNKYADKILFEADLGVVEPGLDKNDDEPYNTPLVKIDEDVKVLPSQNKAWGFYNELYSMYDGDVDKIKKSWNEMFEILSKLTGKDSKSVRDFLDSKAGRYLADEFYNDIKNGNLKKAFEKKYDVNKFNKAYKSFLNEAVEYVELPYLMRKPNDLEDLKRFHNKHKNDPKEKYMVVYTMELTNDEYNEWTSSFLGDFPFGKIFKKYGGTSKDGKTTEVVRIKSKNKPTLYVDPEGYDYARYVALEK